jgi:MFS family permease
LAIVNVLYFLIITAFSIMTTAFVLYTQFRFGYNEQENGYLFAFIGGLSAILQGGAVGTLTRKFGEKRLIVVGAMVMAAALFAVPFVSPAIGGLVGLLAGIACFAFGNSISNPALTTLGSLYSPHDAQGAGLGILQSSASLARAVGPMLAGYLLYSAAATNKIQVNDFSIFRTFWTATAIMLAAVLLSLYFLRKSGSSEASLAPANAAD